MNDRRGGLQYDQALEQGLPIATAVIEGACRYLVKDRMDITGARWGLAQAEAILKLRSLQGQRRPGSLPRISHPTGPQAQLSGAPIPVAESKAA